MDTLVIGADYYLTGILTARADPSADYTAMPGANDITISLSDTPGGAAISSALAFAAAESFVTPGTYFALLPGALSLSELSGRVGRRVYQVARKGSGTDAVILEHAPAPVLVIAA